MKLTRISGPRRGEVRDSKCSFGCGYDSKDAGHPLIAIAVHESRVHGATSEDTLHRQQGGVDRDKRRQVSSTRRQISRTRDIDRRLVEALHLTFPAGINPDQFDEVVTLISVLRGVMANGTT